MIDPRMPAVSSGTFLDTMSVLASGVAVVTATGERGAPCGLLVSSLCSYSAAPPSVLLAVDRRSRSYAPLLAAGEFGVHLLNAAQDDVATVFAGRGDDKFAPWSWSWDGTVPRLKEALAYLRCARGKVVEHGDHAVLIGDVLRCEVAEGEPLVYFRRSLGWRLHGSGSPP